MAPIICPTCGKPIRSAAGCSSCKNQGASTAATSLSGATWEYGKQEAAYERMFRWFALPTALVVAFLVAHMGMGHALMRTFLSMWLHELGHASAAWLCGFPAFPGPWFTPIGQERSYLLALGLAVALAYGGYRAWRGSYRAWAMVALLCMLTQTVCTFALSRRTAEAFVLFLGDGGGMILGCLLMCSFYLPAHHKFRADWLRWGFLVIGAASFADPFSTWWTARRDQDVIPFGENEGSGPSDPSRLADFHGWSTEQIVHRYVILGILCLLGLAIVYALGLLRQSTKPASN